MYPLGTRSSLELMLESIQQKEENEAEDDMPPAIPLRPVSKARLPPGRRSWPTNFPEDIKPESRRTRRPEDFVDQSACQQRLAEECACGDTDGCVLKKLGQVNDPRERAVHGVIVIQKSFRGHQARCRYNELTSGMITLQSLIRGWISRKQYHSEDMKKDHVEAPYADIAHLQRRILKAEATIGSKEEENDLLRLRLEEYEERWQKYEAKMKSMEEMWQDQLNSIQVRVAASERSLEVGPVRVSCRLNTLGHLIKQPETGLDHDKSILVEVKSGVLLASCTNAEEELQVLTLRFESWNKDYTMRLRETKAILKKAGHTRIKMIRRKWWEK